jgi:hypothetical protein
VELYVLSSKPNVDEPIQRAIYGVAVPAPEYGSYSPGLVFDRDLNQTVEIKRIESTARTFKTKKQAEKYALDLGKAWVDKQPC